METAFNRKSLFLIFVVLQLVVGVLFYKFDVLKESLIGTKYHIPSIKNPNDQGSKIYIHPRTAGVRTSRDRMQINQTKPARIYRRELDATALNTTYNRDTSDNQTKYDITPDYERVFLLMIVNTTPDSFKRRRVVRTTWGDTHKQIKMKKMALFNGRHVSIGIKLVFVLGVSGDENTDNKVKYEAEKFGDILRVTIKENYRNIVYKILGGYSWAKTLEPSFILKADHDVYINVRKLLNWLLEPSIPPLLYSGYVHENAPVVRENKSLHYISKEDLETDTFPDYCAGPCYVISWTFLSKINTVAKEIKIFEVEDAFIGVVADHLHITALRTGFFKWDRNLSNGIREWSDDDLSKFICLGDSLDTDIIDYLHFKYMQL